MELIEFLIVLLLAIGALASGGFFILFSKMANWRDTVARQILALNAGVSGVLVLALVRRFGFDVDVVLYGQMILFVFIDAALIYQFVMFRQARGEHSVTKEQRDKPHD